jgi:uncharacterized protein
MGIAMPRRGNPTASSKRNVEDERKANDQERCAKFKEFKAIDDADRIGDLDALLDALGNPAGFPNCLHPSGAGLSDFPLEHAIYWSPLVFIQTLLEHGADPNYPARDGFPSLIAALSTDRADRLDVVRVLLSFAADVQQRGVNDWTPLHCAVSLDDATAVTLLLAHGADPKVRTRIDDCATPVEEAEKFSRRRAFDALKKSGSRRTWNTQL